jgi:hypothetical protein
MNSWATGSEPRRRRRRRAGTISFSGSLLAARRLKVAAQHRHRAAAINDRPAPQRFGPAVRFHINNPSHRRAAGRLTGSMATIGGTRKRRYGKPWGGSPGHLFQVAQHPVERLLVGIVVLPAAEVADVSLVTELHCPWLGGLNYGVVDPDGKQHELVALPSKASDLTVPSARAVLRSEFIRAVTLRAINHSAG